MANPLRPWQIGYEAKRDHKFLLRLSNIDAYYITDVTIPNATINDTTVHNFLSHQFKFPGKLKWGDSKFTLTDPIDLNAASRLIQHIKNAGYVFPSSFNYDSVSDPNWYLKTIKKAGPANAELNILDGMTIVSLTSDGQEIEKWTLKNAFVKQADFGAYKYDTEGLIKVAVSVSCDWVDYQSILPTPFNTAPG